MRIRLIHTLLASCIERQSTAFSLKCAFSGTDADERPHATHPVKMHIALAIMHQVAF